MEFRLSDDQRVLKEEARRFLHEQCPMSLVRPAMETETAHDRGLWKRMADLGWMGIDVPEALGGAGLSFVELALVLEEMGRVVLPGPYFSTAVLATGAVLYGGDDDQQRALLPRLASGDVVATLACWEDASGWDPSKIAATAVRDEDGWRVDGAKRFVTDAASAEVFVVAARSDDEPHLFWLEADDPGVTRTPLDAMDETRKLGDLALDGARAVRLNGSPLALARVCDRAAAALAAEMTGGAERVLELSVEYAKQRVQFGVPIGSFQAIKHKAADMLVAVEASRSAAYYAAWMVAEGAADEAALAASMAKSYVSDAYAKVAGDGIQIHGGIGFTWEHDMHIYYKRAKGSAYAFGDGIFHRERIAERVL
jgi:alkylation response protein AidB-like acyl-CoA dehydrogenase